MTTEEPAVPASELDYTSWVEFALERSRELMPDLDQDASRLILSLYRASSTITYDLESSVHRPHGWSYAGFRLLFALWIAGPLDAKDAARITGLSRQAASLLANTLERDDLLVRSRGNAQDGRAVTFALTHQGRQAIASTYQEHNRREQIWAAVLTPEERSAVTSALHKLLDAAPHLEVRRRA